MIATITRQRVGTVERALQIFMKLGIVKPLQNGDLYMSSIELLIGQSSTEGERKRRARLALQEQRALPETVADKRPLEIDIELEIKREGELKKGQTGHAYDLERRVRLHQSGIDRRILESAESYRQLRESICTDDHSGRGLALYKRKSVIDGAEDLTYEDGSHAYILNAAFTALNMSEPALEDIKSNKGKVERLMTLAAKLKDERWIGQQEGIKKGTSDTKTGIV